jgi:hypothetical protein
MGNNPVSLVDPDGRQAEKQRAQFLAWRKGGEYGTNENNDHYAFWGNSRDGIEYVNFGQQKTITFEYGAKIDFNLGANLTIGGKEANFSILSFNLIESKYATSYNGNLKTETVNKIIGFGKEKTRLTSLQANILNLGYKSPTFGLDSDLRAINISEGGFNMNGKTKLNGIPVKGAVSNSSMDYSTGGGVILTGKIFFNIKY